MPPTLESAIEKAVKDTPLPQDVSEVQPREVKEVAPIEEPEEEEVIEEDQDAIQGRELVRALRDPEKAAVVIDALAKMAGYTKTNIITKDDVREAKKDLKSLLEQHLGDEFKFLAPKMAPALEEYLKDLQSQPSGGDDTSDLRERLDRTELREIQNETSQAHEELAREYFGGGNFPTNVTNAMSRAMDQFPPNDPEMSPRTYYRKMFSLVAGELGLSKRAGVRREADPARQLSSTNRGITPSATGNARKLTLEQAVQLAMTQVDKATR
jgi:hypothetical protein